MSIADKLTTIAENEQKIYDKGHEDGYADGYADNSGINPEWTDWRYFSYYNNRNDLVAKLKYTDTSNGTNFERMFYYCDALSTIPEFDTSNLTSCTYMFSGCKSLKTVSKLNTRLCTSLEAVFRDCKKLENVPEGFDTSNATSMMYTFYDCNSLTTMPLINTSKCTNFSGTFYYCTSLTTIPELDLSSATNVGNIFAQCAKLSSITFTGTISISLHITNSPLSVESMKSLINALTDFSGTSNAGKYYITLSSACKTKLQADGETSPNGNTWNDYVTDKGWFLK